MIFRRHIPQEERSTTIQQTLYLVLRRIDLRMVFTQPVFQAISLPRFQNQPFDQFGLALFLIVKKRKFYSIGLRNAESARHLLLLPKHYFRSEPEFRERNPNFSRIRPEPIAIVLLNDRIDSISKAALHVT